MSVIQDNDAVAARLLAIREQLTTEVWSTAVAAATSGDHERIRDLVKLKEGRYRSNRLRPRTPAGGQT